jgi:hypothetical protein
MYRALSEKRSLIKMTIEFEIQSVVVMKSQLSCQTTSIEIWSVRISSCPLARTTRLQPQCKQAIMKLSLLLSMKPEEPTVRFTAQNDTSAFFLSASQLRAPLDRATVCLSVPVVPRRDPESASLYPSPSPSPSPSLSFSVPLSIFLSLLLLVCRLPQPTCFRAELHLIRPCRGALVESQGHRRAHLHPPAIQRPCAACPLLLM